MVKYPIILPIELVSRDNGDWQPQMANRENR